MLSDAAKQLIRDTLAEVPRGARAAAAARLAKTYDRSVATIYRIADVRGAARRRPKTRPEYRGWVRTAVAIAHEAPKPLPLDIAIEAGVKSGELPPEAGDMPRKTAERVRRELGLVGRPKRTRRLSADWPMQVVLIDGSTSEHLVVVDDGDGSGAGDETRLRLHRKPIPASGYKNKPLPASRLRVQVYGLWDRCTGVVRSRYCVARGETAQDVLDFLAWALTRSPDPRVVLHGVPDEVWIDQGPAARSAPARDLVRRLTGADPVLGEPYAKERMGGVERPHRTRWARFERALFLQLRRRGDTMTLGELNARLLEYEVRENSRASRTPVDGRPTPRTQAWVALTNRRPADNRLREMPADALATVAREATRTIDQSGIVRWDGRLYECEDWHSRKVVVRGALDGSGDIVVADPDTGETRTAALFRPRPHGEIRAAKATALDKLLAERREREHPAVDVYAPQPAAPVVPMPARTEPAAPLENPLAAADRCRDIEEAMRLFASRCPHPLSAGQRGRLRAHFEEAGLDRRKVIEAANAVLRARKSA